jgi:hypothetical protein
MIKHNRTKQFTLVFFASLLNFFSSLDVQAGHLPDRLNLEILPVTMSATHPRGLGFGFSIEKLNKETKLITAIQSELSFPFLQRGHFRHTDWNGSFTVLGPTSELFYIGAKVGVSVNYPDYQIGFMALSFRALPAEPHEKFFFKWMTKQVDLGVMANKNLYAAVRLGFSIL